MKKVLSLVLAASLVASMSAVSFAATASVNHGVQRVGTDQLRYSADSNKMTHAVVEYGNAVYFPIFGYEKGDYIVLQGDDEATLSGMAEMFGDHLLSSKDVVDGLKVKAKYEQGADLVESLSIVKKQVSSMDGIDDLEEGYYYFIEMKTKFKESTSDSDIIATLTLNKSKSGDVKIANVIGEVAKLDYKVKDLEVDIATNVAYEASYLSTILDSGFYGDYDDLYVTGDTVGSNSDNYLEPENYYLLKYNYDDEAEFTFGGNDAQNEGTFTVDVSGQGKNLLYFDTIIDEKLAAANIDAKLFALNFNGVKFNRTGTFVYEGDDFEYAYQMMSDGSLKLIDEFEGGEVSFQTRVLGKYVFSDVELVAAPADTAAVTPVEVPSVTVNNPTTGGKA